MADVPQTEMDALRQQLAESRLLNSCWEQHVSQLLEAKVAAKAELDAMHEEGSNTTPSQQNQSTNVLLHFMAAESWRALEMLEADNTGQLESSVNPRISSKPTAQPERLAARTHNNSRQIPLQSATTVSAAGQVPQQHTNVPDLSADEQVRANQTGAKQGPDPSYIRKGRRYSIEGIELKRSCLTAVSNQQQESARGVQKPAAEKHDGLAAVSEPTAEDVLRRGSLDSRRDNAQALKSRQQQNIRRSSVQSFSGANVGAAPVVLQGASFVKQGKRYSADGKLFKGIF